MALGSQFYKDMSKVEKKIFGISIRQAKAYVLLLGVGIVLGVETFLLPDWAFLLGTLPTAFILGSYPVYLLLDKWNEKKRKIALRFYYQERTFTTGQIRRYDKHEFTQKEGIKETDTI